VGIRLRIDLGYAGGSFSGWAIQPGQLTVQETLETALAVALRQERTEIRAVVAGRTDAGVHATAQVCHVDLPDSLTLSESALGGLLRRVQGALHRAPVSLYSISIAPDGFDARFSALSRTYEYRIADALAKKNPLHTNFTVKTSYTLDEQAMQEVSAKLVGLRDFASFCKPRVGATTIRQLMDFSWRRDTEGVLVATITADAFCHSMVRSLVGAAVGVGRGKISVAEALSLADKGVRTSAFVTMPAHGLCLIAVKYPADDELATRAQITRNKRAADPD
jgi:tRNA pseudouridine38-40 synthase